MKILIAHNSYQWTGGEDFVVEQEAKLLESRGHTILRFHETNARIAGMNKFDLLASTFWNQRSFEAVKQIIENEKIDLVHIHNYFPLLSPSIFAAADSAGAAIVHTAHNYRLICANGLLFRDGKSCYECVSAGNFLPGIVHKCYRSSFSASLVASSSLNWHKAFRTVTAKVDRIIAISEFAAEKLALGGIDRTIIRIKPNFLLSDPGAGDATGKYVVYAGRLSEEKGTKTLIEAWHTPVNGMVLKIAGDGPLAAAVQAFARNTAMVEYLGWLEENQLLQLIKESNLLIFPSVCHEAGVAIVIIQALASGTPIVISDASAATDQLISSGAGCSFKHGDPENLYSVVSELLSNESKLKSMRQLARNLFLSDFSSDSNYSRLMQIYDEAKESRKARINARK